MTQNSLALQTGTPPWSGAQGLKLTLRAKQRGLDVLWICCTHLATTPSFERNKSRKRHGGLLRLRRFQGLQWSHPSPKPLMLDLRQGGNNELWSRVRNRTWKDILNLVKYPPTPGFEIRQVPSFKSWLQHLYFWRPLGYHLNPLSLWLVPQLSKEISSVYFKRIVEQFCPWILYLVHLPTL